MFEFSYSGLLSSTVPGSLKHYLESRPLLLFWNQGLMKFMLSSPSVSKFFTVFVVIGDEIYSNEKAPVKTYYYRELGFWLTFLVVFRYLDEVEN